LDYFLSFLSHYKVATFQKSDLILSQGVEPTYVHVIKKGFIKTYNLTSDGEERSIGFTVTNEVFPLGWVFDKIQQTQYFYEAAGIVEVYLVPKRDFLTHIHSNSDRMFLILDRGVWGSILSSMHIEALEQSKASDKILYTIHYLALFFGHDLRKDVVKIPLPITQQDIANLTGLTRETVGVELKKLLRLKIISRKDRSYIVLTGKLNELLDDEYERQLIR
jgi:CRP-like cAMP-binding protein